MFATAQKVFKQVTDKLSLGAANIDHPKDPTVGDKVKFIKKVIAYILMRNLTNPFGLPWDKLQFISSAVLAEYYQCGNCGEQAALALYESLKSEADAKQIEIIKIKGFTQDNKSDSHDFVMINRTTPLDKPHELKGVVVLDTWEPTQKVLQLNDEKSFDYMSLTSNYFKKINDVSSLSKYILPLKKEEYFEITKCLSRFKFYLKFKKDEFLKLINEEHLNINFEKDLPNIIGKIEKEMEFWNQRFLQLSQKEDNIEVNKEKMQHPILGNINNVTSQSPQRSAPPADTAPLASGNSALRFAR